MSTILHSKLLVAARAAATSVAAQQPFDLDPSFETSLIQEYVTSALVMEDEKLVVSGRMVFQGNSIFEPNYGARLNPNGSRDLSFLDVADMGGRITRWSDKLYCANAQVVRRLNIDGSDDPDFIHMNAGPYFSSLQGGDYHVFPDGRVLMTGTHQLSDSIRGYEGYYRLIWFSNEGYLDTTRVHRQANGTIRIIREQPDGRFLCSGNVQVYEGNATTLVLRVEADGSFDPSFSSPLQGIPTTSGNFRGVYDLEPLIDGRSLVGGFWSLTGSTDTIGVIRLMPDGSQDPSFDPVPLSTVNGPSAWEFPAVFDILPLPDGRMIIGGNFDHVRGAPRGGIALLNADGSLSDEYFTGAGCGDYSGIEVNYRYITGIVPAPNGEYYIHGAYIGYDDGTNNYPQQGFVSRLHGLNVGVREHAFAPLQVQPNPTYGPLTVELPANAHAQHAEVLDANGRVVWSKALAAREGQVQLDLSALAEGAYVLRLRMSNGAVRHGRFVIAK